MSNGVGRSKGGNEEQLRRTLYVLSLWLCQLSGLQERKARILGYALDGNGHRTKVDGGLVYPQASVGGASIENDTTKLFVEEESQRLGGRDRTLGCIDAYSRDRTCNGGIKLPDVSTGVERSVLDG